LLSIAHYHPFTLLRYRLLFMQEVDAMGISTLDKAPMYYDDAALEDRSSPRVTLSIPATLRPSGVTGFGVRVINLSMSGFACEAITGMPKGARCWLALPGLAPLQAEVVRNDGQTVGCAFSILLNRAVLDGILNRFGVVVPAS
jgi:PilZ domain